MAFPINQVLVRLRFRAGIGNAAEEIQDTGYWATVPDADGLGFDWDTAVNAIAAKVRDTWIAADIANLFSGGIHGQTVLCYHYDQTHHEALHRGEAAFGGAHGWDGNGPALPLQSSVVLSLYGYEPGTYVPQRERKRGRMYLPTPAGGTAIDLDGRLTSVQQQAYLDGLVEWWNAMQGAISIPGGDINIQPQVISRASQISTQVGFLRVGRVIDTQRRRRNKLDEQYIVSPVS